MHWKKRKTHGNFIFVMSCEKNSTLNSATILESYEKILENQEHLYALLLITRIPTKTINKSFAEKNKKYFL